MARVLIVDDEVTLGDLLVSVVQDAGHEAIYARHGLEALEMIEAAQPDLIITDIMMPYMSGTEFLLAVRADPRLKGIPVVLLSALVSKESLQGLPSHVFLAKPFTIDDIERVLDDMLSTC